MIVRTKRTQGGLSWDYQACSQVLQPLGTSNKSDMFPPHDWTETWMTEHCRRRFGLAAPGFTWMKEQMGIDAIECALLHAFYTIYLP